MNRILCKECRQCNRKGKPSVSRYSKYCNNHHINKIQIKKGNFKNLFNYLTKIKDKYLEKRTKINEKGEVEKIKTKGFREDWFYR